MNAKRMGVREFLRERLSPTMYDRLSAASNDFTLPVFQRDPKTGEYECILDVPSLDGQEQLIDAACTACELLAASGGDFFGDPALLSGKDEKGEITLEYRFGLDDEPVLDQFRRLLAGSDQQAAGVRADVEERPDGYVARVRVQYESDFDYQRKKDSVDWMLHLARKKANNSPFSGWKL